jgi:dienelactone hydrolase
MGLEVWDVMRAIDYLYTRDEVDKERIGVTGGSGGGSQTIYATILDDRIKVAVPVVYGGIMQLGAGYGCICETIPNLFPNITPSILRALVFPKKVLFVNEWEDPEMEFARQIYESYGVSEYFGYVNTNAPHDYSKEAREEMYAWFNRWFLDIDDPARARDPENLTLEPLDILRVGFPDEHENLFDLNFDFAGEVYRVPQLPNDNAGWLMYKDNLSTRIIETFGGFPGTVPLNAVCNVVQNPENVSFTTDAEVFSTWEGEAQIPARITGILYKPTAVPPPWPTVILIHPHEYLPRYSEGEDRPEYSLAEPVDDMSIIQGLTDNGYAVFSIVVRYNDLPNDEDAFTLMSAGYGRILFGKRVWDVKRTLDYLETRNDIDNTRLSIWGEDTGGLLALYVSALDNRVRKVVVSGALSSYIFEGGIKNQPLWIFIPGILKCADIAQVASLIAPRTLIIANPIDGAGHLLSQPDAQARLQWTTDAYDLLHAGNNISILTNAETNAILDDFLTESAGDPQSSMVNLTIVPIGLLILGEVHKVSLDWKASAAGSLAGPNSLLSVDPFELGPHLQDHFLRQEESCESSVSEILFPTSSRPVHRVASKGVVYRFSGRVDHPNKAKYSTLGLRYRPTAGTATRN